MHRVHLGEFEGPLDLLLFFIRRDEVDVYDIPIARIADEYLAAVRAMQHLDLDGAAEFVYTAALLIQIKARMLLPRPPAAGGEEPEDPRAELVERLVEYVRYREAGERLGEAHDARQRRFARGQASGERERLAPEEGEEPVRATLFDLLRALTAALERGRGAADPYRHEIEREPVLVETQKAWLLDALASGEPRPFVELVEGRSKPFVIGTFLAVLDLLQRQRLRLRLGVDALSFSLEAAEPEVGADASAGAPEATDPASGATLAA